MYYSLADFLNEQRIPEIQLLTKARDFHDVIIEYISVQELPAQKFIEHNELVLTTGIGCQNEQIFLQLIYELSNAAAVFITFENPLFTVPPSVITLANNLSLPLFLIPWEYRFVEIQTYVIEKIQEKKNWIYQDLQADLCNLFFEGNSLHDAAALIENRLKHAVAIFDQTHQIVGISGSLRKLDAIQDEHLRLPIRTQTTVLGELVFYTAEQAPPLFDKENLLIRFLCFPLSLWFNRKNTEDILVTRMKNDFIWNLSSGYYTSLQDMIIYGRQLNFDLTLPYTCVLLKVQHSDETESVHQYSNITAVNTATIEALLILAAKKKRLRAMVANRSLEFIIYIENKSEDPSAQIDLFLDVLNADLKEMFPYYMFYWGISEVTLKISDFSQLYKNASIALQHSLNSNHRRYRCNFRDTEEAQIITILSEHREIRELVKRTIGSLQNYDSDSTADLLGTLSEFIRSNYNISKTARNLHIHRQSLLYRLGKIEEITEMSLDNHRDLFLLEVSIRMLIGEDFY